MGTKKPPVVNQRCETDWKEQGWRLARQAEAVYFFCVKVNDNAITDTTLLILTIY